jgi:hypothetical protein
MSAREDHLCDALGPALRLTERRQRNTDISTRDAAHAVCANSRRVAKMFFRKRGLWSR